MAVQSVPQMVRTRMVSVTDITHWIYNPPSRISDGMSMDDLISSIRTMGQLTPVLLVPRDLDSSLYVLVDGHRRLKAIKALGWPEVRAEIPDNARERDIPALVAAINLTRKPYGPNELMQGVYRGGVSLAELMRVIPTRYRKVMEQWLVSVPDDRAVQIMESVGTVYAIDQARFLQRYIGWTPARLPEILEWMAAQGKGITYVVRNACRAGYPPKKIVDAIKAGAPLW